MNRKIVLIKWLLGLAIIQVLIGSESLLASDSFSDDECALLLSEKYLYGHDHPTMRTIRSQVSAIKIAFLDIETLPDKEKRPIVLSHRNQLLALKSLILTIQLEEKENLLQKIAEEINEDYKYIINYYTQYFSLS